MEKKYEFTEETLEWNGHILHRIKALRDFGKVKAGRLGGWIEKEDNLSHEGNCWVDNDAKVCGNAIVCDDAIVYDDAVVNGDAKVYGDAQVGNKAVVYGHAMVFDDAQVGSNARVCGGALVYENAKVFGDALVSGNALVYDDAKVYGDAVVNGDAEIGRNAEVKKMGDYVTFRNFWSSGRWFTWTRSNNMWKVGCFYGTGEELIAKAYADSEISGKCYEMVVKNQSKFLEVLK